MKTILISIAIVISSLISNVYANGGPSLGEQMTETVKFENGELPLEKNQAYFVKVSFTINEDGGLKILELNYSDEKIKDLLIDKLSEIKIEDNCNTEEIYNYNFSFIKR